MSLPHECSRLSIDTGYIHLPGSNSIYLSAQLSTRVTPPFILTIYYGLVAGFSSDVALKTRQPTPREIDCVEYRFMHRESGMVTVPPPTLDSFLQDGND